MIPRHLPGPVPHESASPIAQQIGAIAPRYLCVRVPEMATQALLRTRPELRGLPIAVLEGEPPLEKVCSMNRLAAAAGVEPGMTLPKLVACGEVHRLRRSATEEQAAVEAMLDCAGLFSPRVELCADPSIETQTGGKSAPRSAKAKHAVQRGSNESKRADASLSAGQFVRADQPMRECVLMLDITGTERLLGEPRVLAENLRNVLRKLEVHAAMAVAPDFYTAWCAVRGTPVGRTAHIAPGQQAVTLAPLPLAVLPLSPDHAATLQQWGIRTLGELAALPEAGLIARLGQVAKQLRAMALGTAQHLFVPTELPSTLEEQQSFDFPVELLDSLLFVLGPMLDQLLLRAQVRALALAEVTVEMRLERNSSHEESEQRSVEEAEREGDRVHVCTVRPALPAADRTLLLKLLHLELQAHPPVGGVVGVALRAVGRAGAQVQLGLFTPQMPEISRLDVTLARIAAIVGEGNVGRAVLADSHRRDAVSIDRFSVVQDRTSLVAGKRKPCASEGTEGTIKPVATVAARRRLRPPEPVAMHLRHEQPSYFFYENTRWQVERAYGPWQVSGDWWTEEAWAAEQWDLVARALPDRLLCCSITHVKGESKPWQMEEIYD